jgi:hypothetical protein
MTAHKQKSVMQKKAAPLEKGSITGHITKIIRIGESIKLLNDLSTIIIAVFTVVLAVVAWLQWSEMKSGGEQTILLNRAFIYEANEIKLTLIHESDGTGFVVTPIWENSGNTPTVNLSVYTNFSYFLKPMSDDFKFPDFDATGKETINPDRILTLLAPKAKKDGFSVYISSDKIRAINEGKGYYYFYGWARYRDVFDNTKSHVTKFCEQAVRAVVDIPKSPNTGSLELKECPRNNCADTECTTQ